MPKIFVPVNENVLVKKIKTKPDGTVLGQIIVAAEGTNFGGGDIISYKDSDADVITITNDRQVDVIWFRKIKCRIKDK